MRGRGAHTKVLRVAGHHRNLDLRYLTQHTQVPRLSRNRHFDCCVLRCALSLVLCVVSGGRC